MSDIKLFSLSNGLKFSVVALPGVGHMPGQGEEEKGAARAMQRLMLGVGGASNFGLCLLPTSRKSILPVAS